MRRLALSSALFAVALACLPFRALAQTASQFTIAATDQTARIRVDGLEYTGKATFLWPIGSKHSIDFPVNNDGYQYGNFFKTRYLFGGWTDGKSLLQAAGTPNVSALVVTADPSITNIIASVTAEHLVQVIFYEGQPLPGATAPSTSPVTCGTPGPTAPTETLRVGVVYVNGNCYWSNVQLWLPAGELRLNAYPFPGFVFLGWKAQATTDAFLASGPLTGPVTLHGRFTSAKRVKFRTEPPGLKVRVDRQEVRPAPTDPCEPSLTILPPPPPGIAPLCFGDFDFAPGSEHVVGAPSPQLDRNGKSWLFDSYTNGLGQNGVYKTPQEIYPAELLIAKFVPGIPVSFTTKPANLKVKIDGRDNWPEPYFVFAAGTKHTIEAPSAQADTKGRRYRFKGWSNGGPAAQEVTVPDEPSAGLHLIAEYELLSQIVVRSNPAGGNVLVDGESCATPCKVDRPDGSDVSLAARPVVSISEAHRLQFVSWSTGPEPEQLVKATGADPINVTVNYEAAYRFSVAADPPEAAKFSSDPPSADGFYPSGTFVTFTAQEQPGFKFRRWDLGLEGTSKIVTFTMDRPRTAIARFDKVPFISPAGVRNAAGDTGQNVVAPGSLVSIFGANLAPYFEAGPSGPILSQAIAGVSVLAGGRILPLLFVSPEQINAQLPRDLATGENEIRIVRTLQPEVRGIFEVAQAAPGLFSQRRDDRDFAIASHADGSPVTNEKPARRGEEITVLGTGFGDYNIRVPEGFAVPGPGYKLTKTAEVIAADEFRPEVTWAGGAPGQVGVDLVRFRIPQELAVSGALTFKVRIDGRNSNAVVLPVE